MTIARMSHNLQGQGDHEVRRPVALGLEIGQSPYAIQLLVIKAVVVVIESQKAACNLRGKNYSLANNPLLYDEYTDK
jgi:hypothetical protein